MQSPPFAPVPPRNLFMQPESTAVSQHTFISDSPRAETLDPTQHGHDFCGDDPVSDSPRRGEDGDRPEVVPAPRDRADSPLNGLEDSIASSSSQQAKTNDFNVLDLSHLSSVSFGDIPNGMSSLFRSPITGRS